MIMTGFEFVLGAILAWYTFVICIGIAIGPIARIQEHRELIVPRAKQYAAAAVAPRQAIPRRPAYVLGTLVYGGILLFVGAAIWGY